MTRFPSAALALLVGLAALDLAPQSALAQTPQPRPRIHGRAHRLKIDSSPQQAAVYWDSGDRPAPKDFGIAGYTPLTIKVPRGPVKIIVELPGWKPQEQSLDVRKSQTVNFTMERAPQMSRLDLQSAPDGSATAGEAFIDGVDRGSVPNSFELVAGRHQVEVRKQGYKQFNDWIELAEGERRTREISLERAELPTGTLLVTSDAGGEVWVDGVRKDVAPAIITGIPAGDHVVEVRKEGITPWRQTVTIAAGQQSKMAAVFGAAAVAPPPSNDASIRVLASEPDVEVFFDGEDKGRAPITVTSVKPGQHVIEGRKTKYKSNEQNVKVAPGENTLVQLRMEPAAPDRPKGMLKIQSTVPNAEVFLDGSSLGRAPVDRTDLDPGKHYVVVHKDGYTDFKREVMLVESQPVALVADLSATGTLRILSTPEGAEVRVDGELVGRTPVVREGVTAGDHVVEFRLKGFYDHKETMKVEGGREKIFSVDLKIIPTGPTPEQVSKRKTGMSSLGARSNPTGGVTSDFGLGYPYYFTARVMVGAYAVKPLGLDLGVEFKTLFDIYDFSVQGKLQLVEFGPFAAAVRGDLGFGTGINGRDSYFADLYGIASLGFSDVATVSAFLHFSAWTDRFCPTNTQLDNGVDADFYCGLDKNDPTGSVAARNQTFGMNPNGTPVDSQQRFSGSRVYVGFNAVAAIDRLTSVFLELEFVPLTDQVGFTPRMAFDSKFNQALIGKDHNIYIQGGVSLKF
jgi:hypothetical protein